MRRPSLMLAAALLAAATSFAALPCAVAHDVPLTPERVVASYERTRPQIVRLPTAGRPDDATVTLQAFGRTLVMDLTTSHVVDPDLTFERRMRNGDSHRSSLQSDPAAIGSRPLQGEVRGEIGSSVAASLDGGVLEGLAIVGDQMLLFEPASRFDPSADVGETAVYRLSDVSAEIPGAAALQRSLSQGTTASTVPIDEEVAGASPSVLQLAAVADYDYFLRHAGQTEARMLSIVNAVDVIYRNQLNVTLDVTHVQVFEDEADPFSEFASANLLANFRDAATEFGDWRNATGGPVRSAGVAHLFSDRTLGLSTGGAGFGFIDELCDAKRGVSISTTKYFDSINLHALILAHELGHNFGADHDGDPAGSCPNAPGGFIMAAAASGSRFSDCSKAVMTARAEAATCLLEGGAAPRCAQPLSTGAQPTAGDCLYILQAAVFVRTCDPACQCAPKGSLPIAATDALLCLRKAVGTPVTLRCPC